MTIAGIFDLATALNLHSLIEDGFAFRSEKDLGNTIFVLPPEDDAAAMPSQKTTPWLFDPRIASTHAIVWVFLKAPAQERWERFRRFSVAKNLLPIPFELPCTQAQSDARLALIRDYAALRAENDRAQTNVDQTTFERDILLSAGEALASISDLDELLDEILQIARRITHANAASIYVVEDNEEGPRLRFRTTQNDTIAQTTEGFTLPVDGNSIVGKCALDKAVINIPDLYALDAPGTGNNPWGVSHNRSFDEANRYQTRSMLTLPMLSAKKEVIGVIQLINRQKSEAGKAIDNFESEILPFEDPQIRYATILSKQASIALENTLLYHEVHNLFESFVSAAVTAIESRDPTTSGHSRRVCDLTLTLADSVQRVSTGVYGDLRFTQEQRKEIEYASLLHDFGKVGVQESVLVKAKKLYAEQEAILKGRFALIREIYYRERSEKKVHYLLEKGREAHTSKFSEIDREYDEKLRRLDEYLAAIVAANEPSILDEEHRQILNEITQKSVVSSTGQPIALLADNELLALQVRRGSLTPQERKEIESHVVHTYEFLKKIPWGKAYQRVPTIAGAHHEKLSGTGYPSGYDSSEILVETRMMTICDIFDALTASDRPYKKAVPTSRALDILGYEEKNGNIDSDLLKIFIESKAYECVVS